MCVYIYFQPQVSSPLWWYIYVCESKVRYSRTHVSHRCKVRYPRIYTYLHTLIHTYIHIYIHTCTHSPHLQPQVSSHSVPNKIFTLYNTPMDWPSARRHCLAQGSDLATIVSKDEVTVITSTFGTSPLWMGLNDIAMEGTFVWASGDVSASIFRQWAVGIPDNYNNDEDCAELHVEGGWNDNSCAVLRSFVCSSCVGECLQVYVCMYVCILNR